MDTGPQTQASSSPTSLSATEHALALIWSEVLQSPALPDASDDFFELGGDSMAMVLVEARIKEEFSVELPAGAMLGASTLAGLSNLIETRQIGLTDAAAAPIASTET
jgi:acyl carrier protein